MEMDFCFEVVGLFEMVENMVEDLVFCVLEVDWVCMVKGVLIMEWVDGCKMLDVDGLIEDGYDLEVFGVVVIQSFLCYILCDGFFYVDMYQGNLFVELDGMLVVVDFGIVGCFGKWECCFLVEILFGFII